MLSKIYLFIFIFFSVNVFAQKTSFSVQATSNFSFLSVTDVKFPEVEGPVGFTSVSISTPFLLELLESGQVGGGISGKFGVAISERFTYRIGIGLQVRQNTFKRRESSLSLNGFTSVNFNDEEDFNNWSSLSDYYSNWIQTGNYLNTLSTDDGIYKNTFLQFNFIPLEIDYQIVKDKFGVYSNFSLQPVVSVYSDWNGIIENNEENDVFNDLQMGVEVGFQYHIFKSVAVQGSYFRGITDVYKNIKYHAKWNSIRLGIVYNLN